MTTTFTALGVPDDLVAELSSQGIERPFPIQIMTIPDALAGDDVCGKAAAGNQELAYAKVEVLTAGGRAWAYLSVVDNVTGVPMTVPLMTP